MTYFLFPNLFEQSQTTSIRSIIDTYLDRPKKETAYDTEIDLTSDQAIPEIKKITEYLVSKFYNKQLRCYNYWISVSQPGECVVNHNHIDPDKAAYASAVLYIQTNDDCGRLYLEDYDIQITPQTGNLVIFPAKCYHSVSENKSSTARICIAFDFKIVDS